MDQRFSKQAKCRLAGKDTFRKELKGNPQFGLQSLFPSISGILPLRQRVPELCKRTHPASCRRAPALSPAGSGWRVSRPLAWGGPRLYRTA